MKEEEGRCIFELTEKKSEDLNANLVEADWDKKSAKATLDVVERQVEAQHKQLRQAQGRALCCQKLDQSSDKKAGGGREGQGVS